MPKPNALIKLMDPDAVDVFMTSIHYCVEAGLDSLEYIYLIIFAITYKIRAILKDSEEYQHSAASQSEHFILPKMNSI